MSTPQVDPKYLELMQKEADQAFYGPKDQQCPICGGATGNLPWQTKEGAFERMSGYHYNCARSAQVPILDEFEREWTKLEQIKAAKSGQPAAMAGTAGAKIQQAVAERLAAANAADGNPVVKPMGASNEAPAPVEAPAPAPAEAPAPVETAPAAQPETPADDKKDSE